MRSSTMCTLAYAFQSYDVVLTPFSHTMLYCNIVILCWFRIDDAALHVDFRTRMTDELVDIVACWCTLLHVGASWCKLAQVGACWRMSGAC
jgi:hypothetical protein